MASNAAAPEAAPRFYRRPGGWSVLVPRTWGAIHAWLFVVFLVATFGPMFHLWANSTRLVLGWPISIGWILACMVLQTINGVAFYFTTVRPTTRVLDPADIATAQTSTGRGAS